MRFAQEISIFNPFAIEKAIIGLNTSITQTASKIELQATQLAVINGKVEENTASLSVMAEEISSKVESSTFNSQITQLSNQITSKVSSGDIASVISQTTDTIFFKADNIVIDSTYFDLTKDGKVTASGATITGKINATSGQIGSSNPWTIGGTSGRSYIYSGSKSSFGSSVAGTYIGTDGIEVKGATGNTGNVTQIDGNGILTTYIKMYDSGKGASTFMYLDDRTDYTYGNGYRMLFSKGIGTGVSGVNACDNWFLNKTHMQGGYDEGSDRRIKKDISRIDPKKAKAFIMGLAPSEYHFTNRMEKDLWHHGFVAQDVEEIGWDGLVSGKGDELKGIAYTEIIADIVAVLQELLGDNNG